MENNDDEARKFGDFIKSVKVEESLVGMLDILGFSNYIKNYNNSEKPEYVTEIISNIFESRFSNKMLLSSFSELHYKLLSDTFIVYSSNISPRYVFAIICALDNFRLTFLEKGFMCRGAITKGENYISEEHDIIISEAFIKAHEIESYMAKYPRLIIDNEVFEIVKNVINSNSIFNGDGIFIKNRIVKDIDDMWISNFFLGVNHFNIYTYKSSECRKTDDEIFIENITRISDGIEKAKNRCNGDEKALKKLNYVIDSYNKFLDKITLVDNKRKQSLYINNSEFSIFYY